MTAAGRSATALPRTLGIREEGRVLLVAPPPGFDIPVLPPRAVLHRRRGRGPYDVAVVFCPDHRALRTRFPPTAQVLRDSGALWVCWPERASGVPTDLSDEVVRAHGLRAGLVEVRLAALDAAWSAVMFARRRSDRRTAGGPAA